MSGAKGGTLSVKAMINKEKTKVLFLDADEDFTAVLLSFLTLPLGKVVKLLENDASIFGSLSTLYKSLANMDDAHFTTESAKLMLLNPRSAFPYECQNLKLDVTDSERAKYFIGYEERHDYKYVLYEKKHCPACKMITEKESDTPPACSRTFSRIYNASFLVSDDLRITPYTTGLLQALRNISVGDLNGAELKYVTFGIQEFVRLLKFSLFSETPLTDLILNKGEKLVKLSQTRLLLNRNEIKEDGISERRITLKVTVQKSSGKLLFVLSEGFFVKFLFSFLLIPLAGVEPLLDSNTCFKCIGNLCRSLADPIDEICIMKPDTRDGLKRKIPYGYACDVNVVQGVREFMILDDLTVTTFSVTYVLGVLCRLNSPLSDVYELEVEVGYEEALKILKASITSTTPLSDVLMIDHKLNKQPKPEPYRS